MTYQIPLFSPSLPPTTGPKGTVSSPFVRTKSTSVTYPASCSSSYTPEGSSSSSSTTIESAALQSLLEEHGRSPTACFATTSATTTPLSLETLQNMVGSCCVITSPVNRAPPIERVPTAIFSCMTDYLNDRPSAEALTCVNRSMRDKIVSDTNINETALIRNFIRHLISKMDPKEYSAQVKGLEQILSTITPSASLSALRSQLLDIKIRISKVLLTLEEATLNKLRIDLERIRMPSFFKDIFSLTEIYRQLNRVKELSDYSRNDTLINITCSLVNHGDTATALEVARTIIGDAQAGPLSSALAHQGHIEEAVKIARSIRNADQRAVALSSIAFIIAKKGRFDKAIEIANSISGMFSNGSVKLTAANVLAIISIILAKHGQIERAIKIANSVKFINKKWRAFLGISKALAQRGDNARAIAIAKTVPSKHYDIDYRSVYSQKKNKYVIKCAINSICKILVKSGQIDEAIKLANFIGTYHVRKYTLRYIALVLIQSGDIKKAVEVINSFPGTSHENAADIRFFLHLINKGYEQKKHKFIIKETLFRL